MCLLAAAGLMLLSFAQSADYDPLCYFASEEGEGEEVKRALIGTVEKLPAEEWMAFAERLDSYIAIHEFFVAPATGDSTDDVGGLDKKGEEE